MSGRYDRPLTPEQIAEVKDEDIDFPPSVAPVRTTEQEDRR